MPIASEDIHKTAICTPFGLFESTRMQFEHTTNLRALFERLDYYGLTIKPSKCTFGVDSLKFLGFQVSSEGISPLPDRVNAIQNFPRPNTNAIA
ncbi:transposon Ty3-G Gag-Pol polyprotein [Trichonephila clavipes]|nr:transposon Ty3-G Gag-Pol polyprotein [Trichonephila clavipes]